MSAAAMEAGEVVLLNNQGLDQEGGGVTIMLHLARHFGRERPVRILAGSALASPPAELATALRQEVLPPLPSPRGPAWRFQPLRRARHLERCAPPRAGAAEIAICLDCHFARALRRLPARRKVYISLSAIPRQEWFNTERAGRLLRLLQYVHLERAAIAASDLQVVASATQAGEMRRYERLGSFDPLILPPLFPGREGVVPADLHAAGAVVVLAVARLVPLKNLAVIPELAHRLRDLPCLFAIVGRGPQRAALERRIGQLGVGAQVRLLEARADLAPLYAAADVLVHPSRYESFGMVVFEAMWHGAVPVCSRRSRTFVTAMEEFVEDGVSGRLVDFDDLDASAQALRELIEQAELRRSLGSAAAAAARSLVQRDYAATLARAIEELG